MSNSVDRKRKAGVVCGAAAAAAVMTVCVASPGWSASTALVVGGIGTPTLHNVVMNELLGGALRDYDQRRAVNWPAQARPYTGADDLTLGASIRVGTANLNAEIDAALNRLERDEAGNPREGERVTVVGLSAGSLVVTEALREWQTDGEDNPDADEINFVVVADSSRQQIIDDTERYNRTYDYTYRRAPLTPYDTVEVTGEYDGLADFPDRWWNLTAVANALAGAAVRHIPAMFSDLSQVPEENITVTRNLLGGTTTRYLVPAQRLPLVMLNPSLAPREAELKAVVDRGYSRNDALPTALRVMTNEVGDDVEETITPEVVGDDTETAEPTTSRLRSASDAGADEVAEDVGESDEAAEDVGETDKATKDITEKDQAARSERGTVKPNQKPAAADESATVTAPDTAAESGGDVDGAGSEDSGSSES